MRARLAVITAILLWAGALWAAPASAPRHSDGLHGVVNLNAGDAATLERLPGIGPNRSKRIIDFRRGHPFKRIEELTKVKGIGRKTVARLRPYLSVSGPTTLTGDLIRARRPVIMHFELPPDPALSTEKPGAPAP